MARRRASETFRPSTERVKSRAGEKGAKDRAIRMSEKSCAGFWLVMDNSSFRADCRVGESQLLRDSRVSQTVWSVFASSASERPVFLMNLLFRIKSRLRCGSAKK